MSFSEEYVKRLFNAGLEVLICGRRMLEPFLLIATAVSLMTSEMTVLSFKSTRREKPPIQPSASKAASSMLQDTEICTSLSFNSLRMGQTLFKGALFASM